MEGNMKKLLLSVLFISIVSVASKNYIAKAEQSKDIYGTVILEEYENGKKLKNISIADFSFQKDEQQKWHGYWQSALFISDDEIKKVILLQRYYSTEENSIKNFKELENGCSFDLAFGLTFDIKIIMVKNEQGNYSVKGSAIFPMVNVKEVKTLSWESRNDKLVKLPYQNISF